MTDSTEVVVTYAPTDAFLVMLVDLLKEARISSRVVDFANLPVDIVWDRSTLPDHAAYFLLVPRAFVEAGKDLVNNAVYRCKICLVCEAFLKPGVRICTKCGTKADERDPDEIRIAYHADLLEHQRA